MNEKSKKIIVILGPTSSGKSDVAIKLARKFNGEIISADSRQIYRGMDIGTGKVTGALAPVILSKAKDLVLRPFFSQGIPHYMLDIISPKTNFTAAQFKKKAEKIIADILKRGKVPVICGGTGFWIKSLVDNVSYPEVKPDWKLREKLNKKTPEKLLAMLKKLDPARANNIDVKNPVRLIRAIEICKTLGKVPRNEKSPALRITKAGLSDEWEFLQLGISLSKEKLHQRIKERLDQRFKQGMIAEVKRLHSKDKVSWKRLESFGLGYKLIPQYLRKEILTKDDLFEKIYLAEKNYAKRQMTWFSKDKRIKWFKNYRETEKEVKKILF